MYVISRQIKAIAACALLAATGISQANPIFGDAKVQKTSLAENKQIIGKSSTQDLYGYYGNYYAATALQYGSVAQYYRNSCSGACSSTAATYYGYATTYAYYAYYYYYYAARS